MSSRRRQYPKQALQPQVPVAPQQGYPPQPGAPLQTGYPQYPGQQVDPNANGAYGAPQQSIDAATQGLNNLSLNTQQGYQQPVQQQQQQPQQPYGQQPIGGIAGTGAPVNQYPPQPAYPGYPAQAGAGPATPAYGSYGASIGNASSPYEANQYQQAALPMNQLYQTDLLSDLPPPIADLSFPPPPLVIPAHITAVPGNTEANAKPEYMRSTLNAVPSTNSLLKKSKLPFAIVVRPYITLNDDVKPVPVVSDTVIGRCRRCRTYINSFVEFTEQGRRWRCNLCSLQNDVPAAFDYNKDLGVPADRMQRNELKYSTVEFVAPPEYAVRTPQPLVYVFVLDVSIHSIKSGLLATVVTTILESLDRIPNKDGRTKVAFIGVDSSLHYFSIPEDNEENAENSIIVVPDLDEPFIPSPDSLLVNLNDCRQNIEKLLSTITGLFQDNLVPNFALGPALKSAHHLIESIGGKVVAFGSTLPDLGVGKLTQRDEAKFAGTPKEASALFSANDSFYKSFAVDCNKAQVTIDFFLTGAKYQDVATLSNLPRYTAGQTHYYAGWSANSLEDVTKLSKEISNHISSDIALEAVQRTRGSSGLRMSSYFGNFFNRSSDLCSFPAFPRDQSYVIEVAIEENLVKPVVFIQTAVLHTTNFGERRIRVLTMAIPTTQNLAEVYASADQLAITAYYTQKAIEKVYSSSFNDARDLITKYLVDILTVFKKEIVSGNVSGGSALTLSTNLRMLPLLIHALTKHIGLRGGKVPADHRTNAMNLLSTIPVPQLIRYIYPTVYSLHDMADDVGLPNTETNEIVLPPAINASAESFERHGLYLINNSVELFLWISGDAVPDLVYDVFGVQDIFQVPIGKSELPVLDNDFNIRVRNIINKVRESDDTIVYQSLYIVRGGSANEPINAPFAKEVGPLRLWAASNLVEDRINNLPSYREFLTATKSKINV